MVRINENGWNVMWVGNYVGIKYDVDVICDRLTHRIHTRDLHSGRKGRLVTGPVIIYRVYWRKDKVDNCNKGSKGNLRFRVVLELSEKTIKERKHRLSRNLVQPDR